MSTTTSIFGNNLEAPCAECGGHPLLAVHDANGGKFSHKYAPAPPKQPALEGDETIVEPPRRVWLHVYADADCWCCYHDEGDANADRYLTEFVRADVTDHARAALVPGLVEALKQCKTELECSMMTDGRDAAIRASGGVLAAARKAGVE